MARSIQILGILAIGLLSPEPAPAQTQSQRRIVVFKSDVPQPQRLLLAQSFGSRIVRELPLINAIVIEMPDTQANTVEITLRMSAEVARIDKDPKINWLLMENASSPDFDAPSLEILTAPSRDLARRNAFYPPQTPKPPVGQETPWGITKVQAPAAWNVTQGEGVKLAVIDTGIDLTHPDLAPNIKGGWNAITTEDDFNDDHGHGSHISGTIAAVDNDQGVVGVAPKVSLYSVKVLDKNGLGNVDDILAGMQWAVDHKMEIVNMSLGSNEFYPDIADMVSAMVQAGVIFVAAAGNSQGPVGYPAAYPGAIAITASDINDNISLLSNRGPEIAFIAPGMEVRSTSIQDGYKIRSGTSMAAPHVSGLMALYVAKHKGATPAQARAALAEASHKLPNVPDIGQGAGLPDAVKLVNEPGRRFVLGLREGFLIEQVPSKLGRPPACIGSAGAEPLKPWPGHRL